MFSQLWEEKWVSCITSTSIKSQNSTPLLLNSSFPHCTYITPQTRHNPNQFYINSYTISIEKCNTQCIYLAGGTLNVPAPFVMLEARHNIRYLCCLSMHRQQAECEPHSWSSVRATQHAALSSLLWAGPSTPPPVVMLRLRLVSFFSSLAKEMTFFLSSRTTWKQK